MLDSYINLIRQCWCIAKVLRVFPPEREANVEYVAFTLGYNNYHKSRSSPRGKKSYPPLTKRMVCFTLQLSFNKTTNNIILQINRHATECIHQASSHNANLLINYNIRSMLQAMKMKITRFKENLNTNQNIYFTSMSHHVNLNSL